MANLCCYSMRIKGCETNVREFYHRISDSDRPNHLNGFFDSYIGAEYKNDEGTVSIDVLGTCAWSIGSCCKAGDYPKSIDKLVANSKELGLKIEIWSNECGMSLQEYYLYDNGQCIDAECVDWHEVFYDDSEYESFEEFKKENGIPSEVTESDLDCNDCYSFGGFDNYGEFSI